jgi:hypothetical protein
VGWLSLLLLLMLDPNKIIKQKITLVLSRVISLSCARSLFITPMGFTGDIAAMLLRV